MIDVERIELGHVNLRGNPADAGFVSAAEKALGQALPLAANTVSIGAYRVYWLGPNEWQVVTPPERTADVVGALEKKLAGMHVAVNDLSGGQVALHLAGSHVPDLLARGCTLDLHPAVFKAGDCAQSGLAKAVVLIGCIDASPVYEIIVRRSFSEYLLRWLSQITHSHAGSASY